MNHRKEGRKGVKKNGVADSKKTLDYNIEGEKKWFKRSEFLFDFGPISFFSACHLGIIFIQGSHFVFVPNKFHMRIIRMLLQLSLRRLGRVKDGG